MTGRDAPRTVVVHDVRDHDGTMWRAVRLTADGTLVIEGHDLGPGVQRAFGCREYEFRRSLSAADTASLRGHLDLAPDADLLDAVTARFGSTHELERFLAARGITGEFWNRTGD